jgi:hypothetical protein
MKDQEKTEEKFQVWWDEKEGIIRNVSWGDREERDAKREAGEILEVAESRPGKVLILVDLSQSGRASSGARKVYSDLLRSEKFARVAYFGLKTVTRVIVSFIMNFAGVKNAKYFASEEEALRWLKEERES